MPKKDTCSPDNDRWDKARVQQKIEEEQINRSTSVLPLATIIETGNHIAQASHENSPQEAETMKNRCLFIKSKLLGFFKGGRQDFESCVAEYLLSKGEIKTL